MAKLTKKVGYNPEYWANQSEADFVNAFKEFMSPEKLKEIHKQDVKTFKVTQKAVITTTKKVD